MADENKAPASLAFQTDHCTPVFETRLFDLDYYKSQCSLRGSSARELFEHYKEVGVLAGLDPNEFFDTSWYLENYIDVRLSGIDPLSHYYENGVNEGRDPGPGFSGLLYYAMNPEVFLARMNPLLHYLEFGKAEGRLLPTRYIVPTRNFGVPPFDLLNSVDRAAIDVFSRYIAKLLGRDERTNVSELMQRYRDSITYIEKAILILEEV